MIRRALATLTTFGLGAMLALTSDGASGPGPTRVFPLARRRTPTPPPEPMREFRGAWVSPINDGGLSEWPSRPGLSADSQRAELRRLFDRASAIGLNTIILHV